MAEIVIFGGTTEGRELAEYAVHKGLLVLVSVVSEYGKGAMEEQKGLSVRCGALEEEGMTELLKKEAPRLVVDATHPYAAAATEHIVHACGAVGIRCLRVLRAEGEEEEKENPGKEGSQNIFWADTVEEAAERLQADDRPVLLTTGSKELKKFAAVSGLSDRLYARVLPDSRVLAECEALGITGRHLIAMQGPFSAEMNRALIHSVCAAWLVTKESGKQGGFAEKLEAARDCGISVIVIRRPAQRKGISVREAEREISLLAEEKPSLSLIGMGMGAGGQLTLEALRELEQCDVVFGAARMLEDVKPWTEGKTRKSLYQGEEILQWLASHPEYSRAAVVYSGDTGFYSGCSLLLAKAEKFWQQKKGKGFRIRVFPGISTLSCLCARTGQPWEEIYPASAHGRSCDIEKILKEHRKAFLLLGGEENLRTLCKRLTEAGMGEVRVCAGVRLGYPDEQIIKGCAQKLQERETDSLTAVILERSEKGEERTYER